MSHTKYQPDLDPKMAGIQTEGHFHHVVRKWECIDEHGHHVSLEGAETEVAVKHVDEDDYRTVGILTFPQRDLEVPVQRDGFYEVKARQRTRGGRWADWTNPKQVRINLQPAMKPRAPEIRVLESDGNSTVIEAFIRYPDRDLQGNDIEPAQAIIEVLRPCGDGNEDWQPLLVLDYPDEKGLFRVPVLDGTATYQARVVVTNICDIRSEESDVTVFNVEDVQLASSGVHDIMKGCL